MDGIIFDVDGTLWDSTEAVARSWNQAIEENTDFSLSLTADWLKSLFGKTMDEITLALFPSCPKEERDRIGYLCFNYENRLLETDHGVLYPDVAQTLENLSQKTDLYIVSNCQCGYIEVFLKTMGLEKYIMPMFCLNDSMRYFLCPGYTDMRKGMFTLCGLVHERMGGDIRSGEVFIFYNRFRTKIKLLHAEPGGLVLYEKLLEEGTFKIPAYNPATRSYPMTWSDLVVMVEGINEDVSKGRQRRLSNLKKHW